MKILYLAHRIPYPPNKGDKIRSFNEIKYLSKSHEIDLACLADDPNDLRYKKDLEKYCRSIFIVPFNPLMDRLFGLAGFMVGKAISVGHFYKHKLQQKVDQWLSEKNYDAIICFSSPMAEYVFRSKRLAHSSQLIAHSSKQNRNSHELSAMSYELVCPRLIMDFCDVDSDKWMQYSQEAKFPFNRIYAMEGRLLLLYEKEISRYFDHSIFVSQQESDLFLKLFPEARNVSVVPNGVDYDFFSPNYAEKKSAHSSNQCRNGHEPSSSPISYQLSTMSSAPRLVFTGAMDYHANVDGLVWFCKNIFPWIKKEFPEAQFYVVGSNPNLAVQKLSEMHGVYVTGFVEDIRPYYDAADLCVIPLRLARGVQNKVLEAMSMEKAVVTTSKAVQGIEAKAGEHALISDEADDFARAVVCLLKNDSLRKELGARARKFVKETYDWDSNMKKLEIFLD